MRGTRRIVGPVGITFAALAATAVALSPVTSPSPPMAVSMSSTATSAPASQPWAAPVQGAAVQGAAVRHWLSGAAGDEAAAGSYGTWRGTALQIGGTWDNGNEQQVQMYSICPGGSWARWTRPLDVAVGAIELAKGESWAAAAKGSYDARWRANLERIKSCWGSRPQRNLYIRFAHEMNLDTIPWRLRGGQEAAFVAALKRYSNLRYTILPQAKIVLCPNDGTSSSLGGLDIRKLWPGKDIRGRLVANVYAVDSYNGFGLVRTPAQFNQKINAVQRGGAPLGIEKHRQFAAAKAVPFAISEWSNNGDPQDAGRGGESPAFVREFYAWARSHAGDPAHPTAGQLLYEVQFNLWRQFQFWPSTLQPKTADAYRALPWGR